MIYLFRSAMALTIAVTLFASATSVAASRHSAVQGEFAANSANYHFAHDVFGYFFIKGKAPAGFKNIDHLLLGGEGEFGAGAKPPFYGQIRLTGKGKTDYKLLKPTLDGNNLSFQTKAVAGVSYKFEGTLSQTDFTDNQPDGDAVVLTGTLTKMKNGRSIGQAKLQFTWSVGD